MTQDPNGDRVREYFDAFNAADRERFASLLSEDFHFTSPYDDHIDRSAYFARCWPQAGQFRHHEIKTIISSGDLCFVTYEARGPSGTSVRNTELFRFQDGLLESIEVFFGLPPEPDDQKDIQARGNQAFLIRRNTAENLFEKF